MKSDSKPPAISVIVPLYNREKFLPQLFSTIESQTFRNIELILIDDGSEDRTEQWLAENTKALSFPLIYHKQSNAGPYAARNKGLKLAKGEYIAFQDSDDEWPEYHLSALYDVMKKNPKIDWVFGSLKRIDHETREVCEESNLFRNDVVHPFLKLPAKAVANCDGFFVIDDHRIGEFAIKYSVPGSTQCALIRKSVFDFELFDETYRTAYDRFFAIRLALKRFTFAYTMETHQIYHIHDSHISLVADSSPEKLKKSALTMIRGYSSLQELTTCESERNAIKQRLAHVYAWELSMACSQKKEYKSAAAAMIKAVTLYPRNYLFWRSLLVSFFRFAIHPLSN
ncbi:glycosyltransferase family 2 protein [Alteromonas sp.]|uniref:glycosyltransferase family 2 protein n=1 Tax=Alteromonas sp. TaxID=232 RepID=UPI000B69B3A5|nr:glycosyltransferase family 2 protein [Alteromonas sp.]MAI37320.1 hypothetical protein [Alteromonas sp.]OUX88904.1 MAG: hypothetical protein CBB95_06670 [Alteromonas sp. TMED35]|tara:strand:+ start:18972 stop:19991 length:1020 start_codon:yes stop_codon:yes gene_type:complete